jgi:dTDP-4-amino-4,6-dideoxygalactose transaminase
VRGEWPSYSAEEIEATVRVLESGKVNYWTGGECRAFEKEFAAYHGVHHAIALANGTVALELALRVLGIGEGDEVIVTPRSFFASASCIAVVGAKPVFADIDRYSQNITPATIRDKISKKTKAILTVHLGGWPCDMPAILHLASQYKLFVIEDCAQAHGARISGQLVGSFGDVAAFSFCQDKIMTTAGEGGMLITDDESLWSSAWSYKEHGKNWHKVMSESHPPGFRWLHDDFGSNFRMTEIQAAVGRIQLQKLTNWQKKRISNATRIASVLCKFSAIRVPKPPAEVSHAYYRLYAFVVEDNLSSGWSRDRILEELNRLGVPGLSGSCPEIYREQAFLETDCHPPKRLPIAASLGRTSLAFLVHPTLTDSDLNDICDALNTVLTRASR